MANLRITSITVVDSTDITAVFTEALNPNIGVSNIVISSQTAGVPNPGVLIVGVNGNTLSIQTQPLTTLAAYFITFQSTSLVLFNSLNGDAVIPNDGVSNTQLILGPPPSDDPTIAYLNSFLYNNVYDLSSPSLISSYIQGLASVVSQCLYSIGQAGNENYLSFTVVDEPKTRGTGPFDRLAEESAYEVFRVGINPTGTLATNTLSIADFPAYPVSLLATPNADVLKAGIVDTSGIFNIEDLILNLTKQYVIILNSVIFIYKSQSYTYDIQTYGYRIANSIFDPDFAFTYETLNNNQIQLNEQVLSDPNFSLQGIVSVQVSYQFQDMGRNIDPASVSIDTVLNSGREVVPPLENIFTLKHAPIVAQNDTTSTTGLVDFIDPNAIPGSNTPHPAFIYEIPFRLNALPAIPGQYSVDYSSGNVYVYGADLTNTGTGAYPPLAVYYYRYVFVQEIDYVYDIDSSEIAALPNGSLIGSNANISYNFEEVLAQGVDYKADVHSEALNELVDNRLVALNAIQTLNAPITDVFRISNQTTGEIYPLLRITNNTIYFTYQNAPAILPINGERASFANVLNEDLFVNATITSGSNNIFQFYLQNNGITSSTNDCIGSSINTSVYFSNTNIFIQEIYFDNALTQTQNQTRLTTIGDYQIDYIDGIVWCLVNNTQGSSVGSISYNSSYIQSANTHLITVNDIYYQLSVLGTKVKHFVYNNFTDNTILPENLDVANEEFLMGNISYPYLLVNNQIGTIGSSGFVPGITNQIKQVRGVYEYTDLLNDSIPLNFAPSSTFTGNVITVAPLVYQEYHTVQYNGSHYYITLNNNLTYLSPNITLSISVVRLSDSAQLWNSSGTVDLGKPIELILPGINSPNIGNPVIVVYSFTINNLSRVVVDYDKGGLYIDYTYLSDELVVSYEYGDNVLDFRQSSSLAPGELYYVSYKVGALRNALLQNFGALINIPILNNIDVSLNRERYRDALIAALQSFTTGPTKQSIYNVVNTIVHAPPEIIEGAFQGWTLGQSLLSPEPIVSNNIATIVPGKYDGGVLINQPNQTISFPVSSNLSLESGSLSCWIIPQWNGIDNQSTINISITKNNITLPLEDIFIGQGAQHPISQTISLNADTVGLGIPNESKDGVFIYYAPDISKLFNRWYIDVFDGYDDGYSIKNYSINITTNGRFYNVQSTQQPQLAGTYIYSGTNNVKFNITGIPNPAQGINFVADNPHYIFDFADDHKHNRFSLFKDEAGYLNFKVIDKNQNVYIVDANISSWVSNEPHFVAISWSLNTIINQDEMHLFIDGFEVPNIIKYGSPVAPYPDETFRTVDPEEIVGMIPTSIVSSIDLVTTIGSNLVSSSLDFNAYGIVDGAIIYIEEPEFSISGYTITNVGGQILTLAAPMPATITNGSFTINKTTLEIETALDLYKNFYVSVIHSVSNNDDLHTISGSDIVQSLSSNFVALGIQPGYLIYIDETGFAPIYTVVSVSTTTLTLSETMPENFTGGLFYLYANNPIEIPGLRALQPSYSVGRDGYCNNTITLLNDVDANDIILIDTLGLNTKLIKQQYYLWSNTSNILKTTLPRPALLCATDITNILLPYTNIGPSNSTVVGNIFTSNEISTTQPSLSDFGRTLSVYVSGDNVNYSTPVQITINGTVNGMTNTSETITFTENTTQNTIYRFSQINYIQAVCQATNPALNAIVIQLSELYPITEPEAGSSQYAITRYSYKIGSGSTLIGNSSNTVSDANNFFSFDYIGNYLVISAPSPAAGQYQIIGVSTNHQSLILASDTPTFSNGKYEILNTTTYSSGLQGGFFTFENPADGYGLPYILSQSLYQLNYYTDLHIPIYTGNLKGFIGSDFTGNNQINAVISNFYISSLKLTDTRIGEVVAANQETITKDYNSLVPLLPNINTLFLCYFDALPLVNSANTYITSSSDYIQSSFSVNANFNQSIVLTNTPIQMFNAGILSTSQGTIEFWINPIFDTYNDPNYRFYFDATSIVREEDISINNATVIIQGRASNILNIIVQVGNQTIDYFAGGILANDMQTIYLNKKLPNENTSVIVSYIPEGTNGNRIAIYKDTDGYLNFGVQSNTGFALIEVPTFWAKNTWHRIKAEYKFNNGLGADMMQMFVDGYEWGNIIQGEGSMFFPPDGYVDGYTDGYANPRPGSANAPVSIPFTDIINQLYIGSDYSSVNGAFALIDNLRISDIFRPLVYAFGEAIDVNYSSNISIVNPVASDLYTTLLLEFDNIATLATNLAILHNRYTGQFDYTVNVYDVLDILAENPISKTILTTLINTLSPANTSPTINYFGG